MLCRTKTDIFYLLSVFFLLSLMLCRNKKCYFYCSGMFILTHVVQDAVSLQLRVPDLALQHHQFLLVLLFERVQTPLAVLQLVDQLLLDGDFTGDVGEVRLEVFCSTHQITSV